MGQFSEQTNKDMLSRADLPNIDALKPILLFPQQLVFADLTKQLNTHAAALYKMIGVAKLNGVDPKATLHHVITDHPINLVDHFLPWHFAAQLPSA